MNLLQSWWLNNPTLDDLKKEKQRLESSMINISKVAKKLDDMDSMSEEYESLGFGLACDSVEVQNKLDAVEDDIELLSLSKNKPIVNFY